MRLVSISLDGLDMHKGMIYMFTNYDFRTVVDVLVLVWKWRCLFSFWGWSGRELSDHLVLFLTCCCIVYYLMTAGQSWFDLGSCE